MNAPPLTPAQPGAPAPAAEAAPAALAAGDLAVRRQAMRLAVGDVAQRLKLSPRQIEALEGGDWAALPGTAFVRGALRGYGRLLGLDVVALLDQVGGEPAEPLRASTTLREPLPRRRAAAPSARPRARSRAVLRAALALALLAALALYFGRSDDLSGIRSWIDAAPGAPAPAGPADAPASEAARAPGGAAPGLPSESFATPPPLVPSVPAPGAATGNSRP